MAGGGGPAVFSSGSKPLVEDAHFDVTPMVDLVFMMNIFFLVTWVAASMAEADLPAARHSLAVDPDSAFIVTILYAGDEAPPFVTLEEDGPEAKLSDPAEVEKRLAAAAETAAKEGKTTLLIKAERKVRLSDVARVARAAQPPDGLELRLAVVEKE